MKEQPIGDSTDFVRVASCETPTQAHLLKGMLESAGLTPRVADANVIQANSWMTQALGGVRVLVPASQQEAARQAIAEFDAGAYQLPGEEAAPVSYSELASPVFSPDRAVLLSFALTPVFGAAVQLANSRILGQTGRQTRQWAWLLVLAALSLAGIVFAHRLDPGPLVVFRASLALSFITVVWYFSAGQDQSKALLAAYGIRYRKRSLALPALGVAIACLVFGWALGNFA